MMPKRLSKKPELLAPAGDLERCKVAIRYGADAAYIGGKSFSLRSRASNFDIEEIKQACEYAKEYGAHIHVTVNMIPHEEDFEGLKEYLVELEKAGVHAIIVASVAIMELVKKVAPKLEVHCSTQMSITNAQSAKFLYEELGIDRVVLARECNIDEVKSITKDCPIETEAFIHGGMCVNYSGQCTLSNRMTLRDANRGGCAQSCRWFYHLFNNDRQEITNENLFTMGSKDMNAIDYVYDLMEAGVSSFKIEGRMKSEYYIACIVSAYRNLIDELYESQDRLSNERMAYHKAQISRGENRSTWGGFYETFDYGKSIIKHEYSNNDVNHDFVGVVKKYDKDNHIAVIETRNYFEVGDCLEVLSPLKKPEQFTVDTIKNKDDELIDVSRHPMALVSVNMPFDVNIDDIVRKGSK